MTARALFGSRRWLALRQEWKMAVGDVNERASLVNRGNNEFGHRPAPDGSGGAATSTSVGR